jgi:hypothetical protein
LVEDVARTVAIAERLGPVEVLPDAEIEANYHRYHTR